MLAVPASDVSAHYFVWEDGRIVQLVAEDRRAWHAGVGVWKGERDLNSASIGVEIVNPGHDGGLPPFPTRRSRRRSASRATSASAGDPAERVLAHSDIAPARKRDPGEAFPWEKRYGAAASAIGSGGAARPARSSGTRRKGRPFARCRRCWRSTATASRSAASTTA